MFTFILSIVVSVFVIAAVTAACVSIFKREIDSIYRRLSNLEMFYTLLGNKVDGKHAPESKPTAKKAVEATAPAPAAPEAVKDEPKNSEKKVGHKVGDRHPNGKWIWTEYAEGKFGWRSGNSKGEKKAAEKVAEKPVEKKDEVKADKPATEKKSEVKTETKAEKPVAEPKKKAASAHKVGDEHPNGKWVWTEFRPNEFGWRARKTEGSKPVPSKKDNKKDEQPAAPVSNNVPVSESKPEPVQTPAPEAEKPVTRAELIEKVKAYNGVTIYDANVSVKVGKSEITIREVNGETALLADGREIKFTAVPFSKVILQAVINAAEAAKVAAEKKNKRAEALKKGRETAAANRAAKKNEAIAAEVKADKKDEDIQPVAPQDAYRKNAIAAIERTIRNKKIEKVTFDGGLKSDTLKEDGTVNPDIKAVINTIEWSTQGDLYFTCSLTNGDVTRNGRFTLNGKKADLFPSRTFTTMHSQINAAFGKDNKTAKATLTFTPSVAS